MRNTYQIVTRINGKEDQGEILAIIGDIKSGKKKNDIRLLNYYNEIPVSYPATIDQIDRDCVEITVHQAQAAVIGLQKQTLLKSQHFPDALSVHCYVEYINVRNSMAVLGRFAYASVRAERRTSVRVNVGFMVKADFRSAGFGISGQIVDISLTGIAISSFDPMPSVIEEGGVINTVLSGRPISVKASFLKSKEADNSYIHMFSIEPDSQTETLISQFIYIRQVEIIRELKDQFE